MQYLLVPVRLEAALTAMDTDRDGHIDVDEWCVSKSETCGAFDAAMARCGDGVLVA